MLKKILFVMLLALQFAAVTPVAKADMDIPPCFPCEAR
jgi:hypothetical protein